MKSLGGPAPRGPDGGAKVAGLLCADIEVLGADAGGGVWLV